MTHNILDPSRTEPVFSRPEAAALLGLSPHYLAKIAAKGTGPRHTFTEGSTQFQARYSVADMREWLAGKPEKLRAFEQRLATFDGEG